MESKGNSVPGEDRDEMQPEVEQTAMTDEPAGQEESGDSAPAEENSGEAVFELSSETDAGEVSAEELLGDSDNESPQETEEHRLKAILEAVVYITEEPLTAVQLADALEAPRDEVKKLLDELVAEYEKPEHGLVIREVADGYKMGTKAEHHEALRAFVKKMRSPLKLSMAALETLAVVAYKQPITAPEIMEIRGVQGAGVLKTLLDRKLITTAGRKQVIGKPILYKTTKDFLVQFGLKNLKELPTLKEFEELARMALSDFETVDMESEEPSEKPASQTGDSAERPLEESAETPVEDAAEGETAPHAAATEAHDDPPPDDNSDAAASDAGPEPEDNSGATAGEPATEEENRQE